MSMKQYILATLAQHPTTLRASAEKRNCATADLILFADVDGEPEEVFVHEDFSMNSLYRDLEDLELV